MMKRVLYIGLVVTVFWLLVAPAWAGLRVERKSGDLSNGLVGYWPFNDPDISGTTVYDRSGQSHNGTMVAGPLKVVGKLGQGLSFDGSSGYVDTSNFADYLPNFSVSVWFKSSMDSASNYPAIVTKISAGGPSTGEGWALYFRTFNGYGMDGKIGRVWGYLASNTGYAWISRYTNNTYNDNTWHQAVMVVTNSNTVTLYIDGVIPSTTGNDSGEFGSYSNSANVRIGNDYDNEYFNGSIDEVRIYNRALSADEVKRLYNIGKGVSTAASQQNKQTSGLVGYWSFNGKDISGTIAYDRSGQGNNGTISGATKTIGKLGQALNFNESNNNVSMGSNLDISARPFTVSAWVKPTSDYKSYWRKIFSKRDSWSASDMRFDVDLWVGTGAVHLSQPNSAIIFSYAPPADAWTHLIVIARSGATDLYVNGALQETLGQFTLGTDATAAVFIGMANGGDDQFHGGIDEVRVYNRALAADEVKALYNQAGSKYHASQQNQLTTGLVGYWPFNGKDISGTIAYDRSGNGNNGTITGATKAIGKLGQGLSFDGNGDYVYIADPFHLNQLTVSAWVWRDPTDSGGCSWPPFVSKWHGGGEWTSGMQCGNYAFWITGPSPSISIDSSIPVPKGQWLLVTMTYDGSHFYAYENTTIIVDQAATGNIVDDTGGINFARNELQSSYFKGLIDDVRVYNRALSAEEIKRLYNMGR
jgi:hypothetical protein